MRPDGRGMGDMPGEHDTDIPQTDPRLEATVQKQLGIAQDLVSALRSVRQNQAADVLEGAISTKNPFTIGQAIKSARGALEAPLHE